MEVCVMIKFLVIILIKDKKLIKSDDLGDFLTEWVTVKVFWGFLKGKILSSALGPITELSIDNIFESTFPGNLWINLKIKMLLSFEKAIKKLWE